MEEGVKELEGTDEQTHKIGKRHVECLDWMKKELEYIDITEMNGSGESIGIVMLLGLKIIS